MFNQFSHLFLPQTVLHHVISKLDNRIHHMDTASSTQVVGSNNLQHPWPTTCLGMQVVGSNSLYIYDVDVLIRIMSVRRFSIIVVVVRIGTFGIANDVDRRRHFSVRVFAATGFIAVMRALKR